MEIKSSGSKPIIDRFKVSLGELIALDRSTQMDLKSGLSNQGFQIFRQSPQSTKVHIYVESFVEEIVRTSTSQGPTRHIDN